MQPDNARSLKQDLLKKWAPKEQLREAQETRWDEHLEHQLVVQELIASSVYIFWINLKHFFENREIWNYIFLYK